MIATDLSPDPPNRAMAILNAEREMQTFVPAPAENFIFVVTDVFDWCVERGSHTLSRHSSQESAYKAALTYASSLFEQGVRVQVTIKPERRTFADPPA